MPPCNAADALSRLQALVDQTNLLVVTPSPPTLRAKYLHSLDDLKARLKVTSSNQRQSLARRPPPEGNIEIDLHRS